MVNFRPYQYEVTMKKLKKTNNVTQEEKIQCWRVAKNTLSYLTTDKQNELYISSATSSDTNLDIFAIV